MDAPFGPRGESQVVDLETEDLPAEEQHRAECLILRAGRHASMDGQIGREVADALGLDSRMGHALLLDEVVQEASNPIDVGALRAVRVVACPKPATQLVERDQGTRVTPFVDDGARWLRLPVSALEEVDEVDPQRVFGLTNLPVRPSTFALEGLAESAYLVGQWLVGSGTSQETADPANAVRCGLLRDEPSRQDELTKLLKRGFELTHRPTAREATAMPHIGSFGCSRILLRTNALRRLTATGWVATLELLSTRDVTGSDELALST